MANFAALKRQRRPIEWLIKLPDDMGDHFSDAWSPREGYEGADRAATYIRFRPKTPQQVIDRIIGYLKEKVKNEL